MTTKHERVSIGPLQEPLNDNDRRYYQKFMELAMLHRYPLTIIRDDTTKTVRAHVLVPAWRAA